MSKQARPSCHFLTMDHIQQCHNVVQSVCEATKHPSNPLLPLGRLDEWDATQASPWACRTVLYDDDDGLFKCWYNGTDLSMNRWWASGYAFSEDGVHWVKPRLGQIEYKGSKDNNMVMRGWGPVIKDDGDPDPGKRFKAMLMGPVPKNDYGIRLACSPDGIHWKEGKPYKLPQWRGRNPDMVAFCKDDQDPNPDRRYKLVWQDTHQSNKSGPDRVRIKCMAFSPDGEHFTESSDNPFLDPNDGLEWENHFLMLAPYAGVWVLPYEYGWYTPNGQGVFGQYLGDIRLAVSTDGEHYQRLNPHQKVIPRGARGQWDEGFLVISDKPAIKDDTIYLYYCGQGEEWTCWPALNRTPGAEGTSSGTTRLSRMGLATLRRDGWACLETTDRETPGWAMTKPIGRADRDGRLVINVSHAEPWRSFVRVEVLDAGTGQVLDAFSGDDCDPIETDAIAAPVRWRHKTLADADAEQIQLRFCLCGAARLHAYGFED